MSRKLFGRIVVLLALIFAACGRPDARHDGMLRDLPESATDAPDPGADATRASRVRLNASCDPEGLVQALMDSDAERFEACLRKGVNPNTVFRKGERDKGRSVLFAAASRREDSMVRLLLRHGAEPEWGGPRLRPIVGAALNCSLGSVQALVESGAAVNGRSSWTPLAAAMYGRNGCRSSPQIIDLLLEKGANPEEIGTDAMMSAVTWAAVNFNDPELVGKLLARSSCIGSYAYRNIKDRARRYAEFGEVLHQASQLVSDSCKSVEADWRWPAEPRNHPVVLLKD